MSNIKVAVIGVGHLGKNHAKFFSQFKDVTLAGVVDSNTVQSQEIARLYHTKAYTDYKPLLKEIDAVSIATPTSVHYQIAKETISRGIHTFIEKPISTTLSQANKLVSLAQKHKVVLQVGHIERFNPAFVDAKDYIQNPRFIECHRLSSFSFRSVDIDVILDLMIHDVDIVLSIVKSPIKRIDAIGVKVISDKIDLANVRILFESGCVVNLTASRASDKAMRKMRIFTDKNYVSIDFAEKTACVYQKKGTLSSLGQKPAFPSPFNPKEFMLEKFIQVNNLAISSYDQLEKELLAFIEAIQHTKKPLVSGEDGRNALAVCHRILTRLQ
ncbi:MAG: Gfo/Idh/MocA family oxidoreductase [Planctomycetota bacterium]